MGKGTLGINGLGRIGKLSLWQHIGRKDFSEIVRATFPCSGRFIFFWFHDKECKAFNDATGFRELYYMKEFVKACGHFLKSFQTQYQFLDSYNI